MNDGINYLARYLIPIAGVIDFYRKIIDLIFRRLRMTEMQTAGENAVGTRRRVKVYQLNDDRQWDDRGTGHVTSQNGPDDVVSLLVRSEVDNNILLDSEIRQDTSYSKVLFFVVFKFLK